MKESYSVPHNINQESTELLLNLKEINDARDSDAGRIISFLQKLNIEYETAGNFFFVQIWINEFIQQQFDLGLVCVWYEISNLNYY